MSKRLIMVLLALCVTNSYSGNLLPTAPTAAEMVFMPDYCKAKSAGPNSPEYQAWEAKVGSKYKRGWESMHHFCDGLNYMNRYLRLFNDPKRGYYLSRAVAEMNYNLNESFPDDFLLAAEMYLNRGLAYQLMHNDGKAAADFYKAIQIDPNKVQAYLGLSDIYLMGNKDKALEIVTSGLKHVPTSKALQKRYLTLGGKEPLPATPSTPLTTKQQNEQLGEGKAMPEATKSKSDDINSKINQPPNQPNAIKDDLATTDKKAGGMDTKAKSPYCRFCP